MTHVNSTFLNGLIQPALITQAFEPMLGLAEPSLQLEHDRLCILQRIDPFIKKFYFESVFWLLIINLLVFWLPSIRADSIFVGIGTIKSRCMMKLLECYLKFSKCQIWKRIIFLWVPWTLTAVNSSRRVELWKLWEVLLS